MLTLQKSSRFLRFFCWTWDTTPEQLNLCTLFWGTLFLPIGIIFMGSYGKIPRVLIAYLAFGAVTIAFGGVLLGSLMILVILIMILALVGFFSLPESVKQSIGERLKPERLKPVGDWIISAGNTVKSKRWALALIGLALLPFTLIFLAFVFVFARIEKSVERKYAKQEATLEKKLAGMTDREVLEYFASSISRKPQRKPSAFRIAIVRSYKNLKERTCDIVRIV